MLKTMDTLHPHFCFKKKKKHKTKQDARPGMVFNNEHFTVRRLLSVIFRIGLQHLKWTAESLGLPFKVWPCICLLLRAPEGEKQVYGDN